MTHDETHDSYDSYHIILMTWLAHSSRAKTPGRLTQLHVNTKKHALSCQCYLHTKCSMIKRLQQLPSEDPDGTMLQWLLRGKEVSGRSNSFLHMRKLPSYSVLPLGFFFILLPHCELKLSCTKTKIYKMPPPEIFIHVTYRMNCTTVWMYDCMTHH